MSASPAGAQIRPEDLPPPLGDLERAPGRPPPGQAAPAGGASLSKPFEIPFILEGGHIIVEASIDASPPKPFVFDTGARNMITPAFARTLNAAVVETARIGGIGPKTSQADVIQVGRIAIGAASLQSQSVEVFDIPNILVDRGSRPRIVGLIGSELLARYAVTIDFTRRALVLNTPGFRPQAAPFSLPLGFAVSRDGLSHPSVSVELDGVAGDFILDTGSGGQVFLSDKFQQEHQPFAGGGKILQYLSPGGIGGHTNIQMGFRNRLRIGSLTLSPPLVVGSTDRDGLRLSSSSGVIGTAILSQFVVTIDYQSGRAYFEPLVGRKLATVLHGTGMILDKPEHEMFEVLDVVKGTAAERAGLHRGDHVVEIAGFPARDLGISDVGALSSASAHTSVAIRTSDQRRMDLAIGRLLP